MQKQNLQTSSLLYSAALLGHLVVMRLYGCNQVLKDYNFDKVEQVEGEKKKKKKKKIRSLYFDQICKESQERVKLEAHFWCLYHQKEKKWYFPLI